MKSKLTVQDLNDAIARVVPATGKHQPILETLLFSQQDKDTLTLTGSNMSLWIETRVEGVRQAKPGGVCIPAREIRAICQRLDPEAEVTLSSGESDRTAIISGSARYQLAGLPATDHPAVDELADPTEVHLPACDLLALIDGVRYAMAWEDVRYTLNGILLELYGDLGGSIMRSVATDGHRLALDERALPDEVEVGEATEDEPIQAIVPNDAVRPLVSLLKGAEGESRVDLRISPHAIVCEVESTTLTARLVDGQYPRYRRVVPGKVDTDKAVEGERFLAIDRDHGLEVFRRLAAVAPGKNSPAAIELGKTCTVKMSGGQHEGDEKLAADRFLGESMRIGLNHLHVSEALASRPEGEVEVHMTDEQSGARFGTAAGHRIAIVMPTRL